MEGVSVGGVSHEQNLNGNEFDSSKIVSPLIDALVEETKACLGPGRDEFFTPEDAELLDYDSLDPFDDDNPLVNDEERRMINKYRYKKKSQFEYGKKTEENPRQNEEESIESRASTPSPSSEYSDDNTTYSSLITRDSSLDCSSETVPEEEQVFESSSDEYSDQTTDDDTFESDDSEDSQDSEASSFSDQDSDMSGEVEEMFRENEVGEHTDDLPSVVQDEEWIEESKNRGVSNLLDSVSRRQQIEEPLTARSLVTKLAQHIAPVNSQGLLPVLSAALISGAVFMGSSLMKAPALPELFQDSPRTSASKGSLFSPNRQEVSNLFSHWF